MADPANDVLLVKANPLDLLTIRRLVAKTLDVGAAGESVSAVRTWVVGPLKTVRAADMAKILQTLYRAAPAASPRLSVAVDERTNALVLHCAELLYQEVRQLVRALEELPGAKK